MFAQPQLSGVVEYVVDDISTRLVDDVVGLPIISSIDVEIMPQKVVLQCSSGTKLADGENIGFHMVHNSADAFVFSLGVVVGFEALCVTAIVVAIIQ